MTHPKGSCLCGRMTFSVDGDFQAFFFCHCTHCQKDTGSAHAANLFSRTATLTWTTGAHNLRSFTLPGTRHTRSFCATCGSAMPSEQLVPGAGVDGRLLVVPAGALDTPPGCAPTAHLFCASQASWEANLADLPRFDAFPAND